MRHLHNFPLFLGTRSLNQPTVNNLSEVWGVKWGYTSTMQVNISDVWIRGLEEMWGRWVGGMVGGQTGTTTYRGKHTHSSARNPNSELKNIYQNYHLPTLFNTLLSGAQGTEYESVWLIVDENSTHFPTGLNQTIAYIFFFAAHTTCAYMITPDA